VKRTQTVGVPDDLLGEMVVTCIVPVDGARPDPAEITAFLRREVASFKVPKRILFCTEAEFSITGNEKARSADIKALAIRRIEAENAGAA
jgi:acyl-CoA synthetase (AMP-forming)/AMP-acid ligase II